MIVEHLASARARLEQGRAEIFAKHRAGAGGQEVVRAISDLTDRVVADLFRQIAGPGEPPLALVATGGYGRRELAPRSDVDLLALLPPAKNAEAERIPEQLHRALWDIGLEAGYAARNLDQCVQLARED